LSCFSSPHLLLLLLLLLCRYISLLRLLRLGRAYRLYGWVQNLTYNQTLSLMAVTLARNFAVSCSLRYMVRNVPAYTYTSAVAVALRRSAAQHNAW
jgi:hypothetical protein